MSKYTIEIENTDDIVVGELEFQLYMLLQHGWSDPETDKKDAKALVRTINMFLPAHEQRTLKDYKEA